MGNEDDRRVREELRRADNVERQERVNQARTSLYEEGYSLAGDHVDGVLKEGSLVPTKVGFSLSTLGSTPLLDFRTHSHRPFLSLGSISSRCCQTICFMNLSSACGKTSSHTSFACLSPSDQTKFRPSMSGTCCLLHHLIFVLTFALISFRQVPVFGETTIRSFDGNVSKMKRLAGHDFEDLLQVSRHSGLQQTASNLLSL